MENYPDQNGSSIELKPTREFAGLIDKFWFVQKNEKYRQGHFEILPDGNFDLLFILADSWCKLVFAGPYTRKFCVPMLGEYDYFGIRFRSGKMPRIADIKPVDLVDTMITPHKILGMDIDALGERLYFLERIESKQAFMEDAFRKAGLETIAPAGIGIRSAEIIESSGGQIKVNDLACLAGVSIRTLERVFLTEVGMPPKTFIRCIRFQDTLEKMRSGKYRSLAEIACECGYADQSHFIKDYKQLSGRLPGCF